MTKRQLKKKLNSPTTMDNLEDIRYVNAQKVGKQIHEHLRINQIMTKMWERFDELSDVTINVLG